MTLQLTGAPAAEPVAVAEAKAFLRLDTTSEDELIAGLIRAAREDVERSAGLALIDQTWRLTIDAVPQSGFVLLPWHPIREIIAVTSYGGEGEVSLVAASDWQEDLISRPARMAFYRQPMPMRALNGLAIDFRAGFGEAGVDVPDQLRRAILVLVGHWYEFRAGYGPDAQPTSYPLHYDRLIAPWRDRRL